MPHKEGVQKKCTRFSQLIEAIRIRCPVPGPRELTQQANEETAVRQHVFDCADCAYNELRGCFGHWVTDPLPGLKKHPMREGLWEIALDFQVRTPKQRRCRRHVRSCSYCQIRLDGLREEEEARIRTLQRLIFMDSRGDKQRMRGSRRTRAAHQRTRTG